MATDNKKWSIETTKNPIKGFQDLEVYQRLYELMKLVILEVINDLPDEEKFDLKDQIRRCCKAGPALIAEGFAKRYQKRNWRKYCEDTIGEINEMIHHLSAARDLYSSYLNIELIKFLIGQYSIAAKQTYNLQKTWQNYHDNRS